MKSEKIFLILSLDVVFDKINESNIVERKENLENLDYFLEVSDIIKKNLCNFCKPKITWMVSDNKKILEKWVNIKENFLENSDEVGMHCMIPHFIDLNESNQEEIERYIQNSLNLFKEYSIFPNSSRVMGCTSSNQLMSALAKSGFKVDSSAIPKRNRLQNIKFDWVSTSSLPYYPSKRDYRIPTDSTSDSLNLLEVPLTTIKTKTKHDKFQIIRYLDLCFSNDLISKNIGNVVKENSLIVTIIHPNQLLQDSPKNKIYSKDISDFKKNVLTLINTFEKLNKKVECLTLYDISKFTKNDPTKR